MRTQRNGGFTLLELMAVVTIISLLMAIAIPSISHRLREYRSQQTANEISALYRNARMRALARGSAVVVRWDELTQKFNVLEAVEGGAVAGCAPLPSPYCPTDAVQDAALVPVNQFTPGAAAHTVTMAGPPDVGGGNAGAQEDYFDVCFSPLGAASSRNVPAPFPFAPLTGVPQISVKRADDIGLTRRVLVLPNGTSRVSI